MTDNEYMAVAAELAKRGEGRTSPNPLVGAVIVDGDEIIGRGFHEEYGKAHAERNALESCSRSPRGVTMYVTLEPCCHFGKQPPCVDAIIEAGISRVVVGSTDPNPLMSGKGIEALRAHGIRVDTGILKEECDRLNEIFFEYITTGRPFVAVKYAMTLDGKIATRTGKSEWITNDKSRRYVHSLRNKYSAVAVGVGTVIADDPMLTCRTGGRNPLRVVCDSSLRTPLSSKIVRSAHDVKTVIATCESGEKCAPYIDAGCEIASVSRDESGRVELAELMKILGGRGVDGVLVEGGGELIASVLKGGLARKIYAFVAPKIFGGRSAPTPVGGDGADEVCDAVGISDVRLRAFDSDILIEGDIECSLE